MASREKINEVVVRPLQELARQMFPCPCCGTTDERHPRWCHVEFGPSDDDDQSPDLSGEVSKQ